MESAVVLSPSQRNCPACRSGLVRFGSFRRKFDLKLIQRFRCRGCGRTFSESTFKATYRQHKPYLNPWIFKLLVGGFSQREIARFYRVNRKTVVRKFLFVGAASVEVLRLTNRQKPKVHHLQFDDMETSEHTKCKPVAMTLAVEHPSRRILGFAVSRMPAKGKLAKIARQKYGPRPDERFQGREILFSELQSIVHPEALIESDMNPHYPASVKRFFPLARSKTYKGRRGCVVGQGELKRGGYDPLFSLNHTCAMLRANINRLFRRTWCTTKKPDRLALHIAMYAVSHNQRLLG